MKRILIALLMIFAVSVNAVTVSTNVYRTVVTDGGTNLIWIAADGTTTNNFGMVTNNGTGYNLPALVNLGATNSSSNAYAEKDYVDRAVNNLRGANYYFQTNASSIAGFTNMVESIPSYIRTNLYSVGTSWQTNISYLTTNNINIAVIPAETILSVKSHSLLTASAGNPAVTKKWRFFLHNGTNEMLNIGISDAYIITSIEQDIEYHTHTVTNNAVDPTWKWGVCQLSLRTGGASATLGSIVGGDTLSGFSLPSEVAEGSGRVTKIVAGTGVSITPASGVGDVTITSTGSSSTPTNWSYYPALSNVLVGTSTGSPNSTNVVVFTAGTSPTNSPTGVVQVYADTVAGTLATNEVDYFEYASNASASNTYLSSTSSALVASSESTIKTQGNYSMKIQLTGAPSNAVLTRTLATNLNLTSVTNILFNGYWGSAPTITNYTAVSTNMTSNTAPAPLAVTASSYYTAAGDAYNIWKTFDGNTNGTQWLSESLSVTGQWLLYDWGTNKSQIIAKYDLISGATADRSPKDFQFIGSNYGSQVILDSRYGQNGWGAWTRYSYTFTNSTAYRYYKLNVLTNNGSADFVGLGELIQYTSSVTTNPAPYNLELVCTNGVTNSYSPAITLGANTWHSYNWDISGITASNKSAISKVQMRVLSATTNTSYIDNMFSVQPPSASSYELRVRDSSGNVTTLSPHNRTLFPDQVKSNRFIGYSHYERNDSQDYELNLDMIGMAKWVEDLSGAKLIYSRKLSDGTPDIAIDKPDAVWPDRKNQYWTNLVNDIDMFSPLLDTYTNSVSAVSDNNTRKALNDAKNLIKKLQDEIKDLKVIIGKLNKYE